MEKEAKWYVYQLIDPRTKKPFYIGKGTGNRIDHHEKEALSGVCSHKCYKINKIHNAGLKIIKQKIAYFWDEQYAYEIEEELIKTTPNLTNIVNRMEKIKDMFQLPLILQFKNDNLAKNAYDAVLKHCGAFAYWYKNSQGGKHIVQLQKSNESIHEKIVVTCINTAYKSIFPKILKNIQESEQYENLLKKELKCYGVNYGC
jgi:hypothetical protein